MQAEPEATVHRKGFAKRGQGVAVQAASRLRWHTERRPGAAVVPVHSHIAWKLGNIDAVVWLGVVQDMGMQ